MLAKLYTRLSVRRAATIAVADWHIEQNDRTAYLQDKAEFEAIQKTMNDTAFYKVRETFSHIDAEATFPEWPEEAPEEATVAVKDIEAVAMFLDLKAGYDVAHAQNAIADEDDYEYQKASLAFREKEQILDLPIFERVPHAIHLSLDFPTWPTTADELEYWKNRMSRIRRQELGA